MDEARTLLIATCGSLARLHMRLIGQWHWRRQTGPKTWSLSDPHWRVEELDPPSPWLDACAPRTEIANLIPAIALVQAHLLGMVEADGPIDGLKACVALHHLSFHGSAWSEPVRRLADRLDVELPAEPRDATNMASLQQAPLPGRQRRTAI
ncbi:hypothetical protein FHW84_002777 [Dyella sp. SG562]|uniref:hypothetical protein n=1 Tax=Dyella sp. SG562 TaxID=2587017 RepID=UPI001421AED0|nr:hypothetical protein [Dyella sp. SG562]NII74192.1 hypothetical protein [Dyella sp. SG562]